MRCCDGQVTPCIQGHVTISPQFILLAETLKQASKIATAAHTTPGRPICRLYGGEAVEVVSQKTAAAVLLFSNRKVFCFVLVLGLVVYARAQG